MAAIGPAPLVTIFVVSVTVMVFFTTSASNRIEKMSNPTRQFLGTLALLMSYCLLLLLGWLLVVSKQLEDFPVLYKAMQVVFAAFVAPGFVLLYDQVDNIEEYYADPDFSIFWALVGGIVLALLYLGIMFASPSSV